MSTHYDGQADIYNERLVTARKAHRCSACGPWRFEDVGGGVYKGADGHFKMRPRRELDHGEVLPEHMPIQPGDTYSRTSVLADGRWERDTVRCSRCEALYRHLCTLDDDDEWGPARKLDCGDSYESMWGDVPEEIAALAFWLPGDPLRGAAS